ncbi:MAG: DNA topoisomerase, partial [Acidobacteriota bacterium]
REIGDRGAIGLITYMRTDSTRVADEAIVAVREVVGSTYGPDAVPEKINVYPSKKGAQDAHEAIRPTTFDLPPDAVRDFLAVDELKLYKLIWDRFIASQMKPAVFDVTQVDIDNGPYGLRATGRVMKSPGFLAVYRETPDEDAQAANQTSAGADDDGSAATLPALREGQTLKALKVLSEQKFTQPPAQFSEATLVKALEENGIGRPSTYATILSTLSDREYAERLEGRFRPSTLGRLVNQLLQQGFNDILNEGYTAALEGQLDEIEDGKIEWKHAVAEFDTKFSRDLETAGETFPNVKRDGLPMDEVCPQDGAPLRIRFGRFGAFVACSNYPECTYTRNLEEPAAATPSGSGDGTADGAAEEA